jgi:hypothetical protein
MIALKPGKTFSNFIKDQSINLIKESSLDANFVTMSTFSKCNSFSLSFD